MAELIDRIAGLCVPRIADWAFVTVLDDLGEVREYAGRHRDGREEDLREFAALHVVHLGSGPPSRQSMATARPVLLRELTPEVRRRIFPYPGALEAFQGIGGSSLLTVPTATAARWGRSR